MWSSVNDLLYSDHLHYSQAMYYSWGRETSPFGRFEVEIVKDQDCTKGENPSIFRNVMMLKEYFVAPAGPIWSELTINSASLIGILMLLKSSHKCVLGPWAAHVRHLCVCVYETVSLCFPSTGGFLWWMKSCCLPLHHLPSRKTATNFLLCNSPWYF